VVGCLESVNQALEALADRAESAPDAPALWVIDELPWFDQAVPGVATTIKEWWDRRVRGRLPRAKLFLAGSLVSWMRAQTLAEGGPLHNRRTRQLHLGPLDYLNAACFYPQYAPSQKVEAYAIFGGMPTYLAELWPGRSPRALYRLADHYVAFWYRYVDRVRHLTAAYRADLALAEIRRTFDRYVSAPAFEDVCREFLMHAAVSGNTRVPVDLAGSEPGSWWTGRSGRGVPTSDGTRPVPEAVQSDQIDIVLMRDGHAVLVGECKWSASLVGRRELDGVDAALRRAEGDLRPIEHPWRAFFSRRGFTPERQERARDAAERLLLFTPKDLYSHSPTGSASHDPV
jgi:hypothetical protein